MIIIYHALALRHRSSMSSDRMQLHLILLCYTNIWRGPIMLFLISLVYTVAVWVWEMSGKLQIAKSFQQVFLYQCTPFLFGCVYRFKCKWTGVTCLLHEL